MNIKDKEKSVHPHRHVSAVAVHCLHSTSSKIFKSRGFSSLSMVGAGPSGRASDSGVRGRGLDPHSGRRFVSLSKIHLPPKKYW